MATNGGPNIIEDGLVFAVDAANKKSYPGSGTTWTDLAGSNNGTLTNGPTFNSGNGGNIVFDGSDDYVALTTLNPTSNNAFTYSLWVRPTSNSSDGSLIGNWTTPNPFLTYYDVGGTYPNYRSLVRMTDNSSAATSVNTNNATLNQWSYVTTSFNSTSLKLYVDGSLVETVSSGLDPLSSTGGCAIGAEDSAGGRHFSGNIATCDLYDRVLTASEVLQNYNALKGRFGL